LREDYAAAERSFAAGLAVAPQQPFEQRPFRDELIRTRVKAGRAVQAYKDFDPSSQTFETIANQCVTAHDAKQLQELIDVHRRNEADDPNLVFHEMQVARLKGNDELVLRLLNDHKDVFDCLRYRARCVEYRIRALVRLKRFPDAVHEAEMVAKKHTYPLMLLYAHAANGDVESMIAVLEKNRSNTYLLKSCYSDEDLGPLLRGESLKMVREKFPEPPENLLDLDDD
jgi:hypothetical protein